MLTITKFISTDGSEWNLPEDCQRRDSLDALVRVLESQLPAAITDSDVRRQLDREAVLRVKRDVVALCRDEFPREAVFKHNADEIHPMSYAGRFLDDIGGPLRRIWWRFACMSRAYDYEQPYYALNEGKFEGRTIAWEEQP